MFGGSSAPSIADIAAVTGNNGGWGNGWGGDGWWVLIILFALFGGWGRGGMFGGNGGCGCDSACATVGDVERGFNNQSTQQRFNGLDQGLSQLGYADLQQFSNLSNGLCQLGYQTQAAVNDVSRQLSECCCNTREAIQGVNYNIAQGFANQGYQLQQCCCDLKQAIADNTRAISDQLTAFRIEDKDNQIRSLESQVQALNLAASQQNQNRYLIDTLRPCPVPAYQTCNPWGGTVYGCCNTAQSCCC